MGVTFSDGSEASYGAVLYLRWQTQEGVVVRIGEIQMAGPVEDWRWVDSSLNISDIVTRGATPEELDEKSEWQEGPEFLKRPEAEWPVKMASEIVTKVADNVKRLQRKAFSAVTTRGQSRKVSSPCSDDGTDVEVHTQPPPKSPAQAAEKLIERSWSVALVNLVNPKRFCSLSKLCGTVAWVRRAVGFWLSVKNRALNSPQWEAKSSKLSAKERSVAFQDLALAAQDGINFKTTALNRLVVTKDETTGLLLCGGRVQSWSEDGIAVPLIPFQSWLGMLMAREAHETNHEGVAATLMRTRKRAWIIEGRRIIKKVINECIICKKQRARLCQQVMSNLPLERTSRANPFEYTTLDLFGPLRFTALRGHPRKLWSDKGTNFVGAKSALKDLNKHLACVQKVSIEDVAAKNGTEWQWDFHPADSPHRNGAAEAAVKLIKRALNSLGGTTCCYTWGEFQTLLYAAANLTNERPIDAKAQVQEETVEYLTPNSLILGRTGHGGDMHGIDVDTHPWRRLRAVQAGVDKFWSKWSELAGPNLFIRHKWHRTERSVKVGDLVWIADQNALRGQFRLGRIVVTYPDKSGVVRDADVKTCIGLPAPQFPGSS
ncbi:hypothetical protein WMY93_029428 [Mugilogobius chulae]|uniref:Integrase catalytic domain-containing protein n=1 Tax=Mugilogobius chulae TaxID=88201 RepID=A0AAW0N244_9GOBI